MSSLYLYSYGRTYHTAFSVVSSGTWIKFWKISWNFIFSLQFHEILCTLILSNHLYIFSWCALIGGSAKFHLDRSCASDTQIKILWISISLINMIYPIFGLVPQLNPNDHSEHACYKISWNCNKNIKFHEIF